MKLKGKKAYLACFATALGALAAYIGGEIEMAKMLELIAEAAIGAAVRHGIG